MPSNDIRPVTILTGFLGAGKTTFLNALLRANPQKRYAIIENEIGQTNIDGMLVVDKGNQFVELQDGCLCCTLNDDLYRSLEALYHQKDNFDELLIECTGLALPEAIIEPFTVHPVFKKYFPLLRTVCMVDAELIEDQLAERTEPLKQLMAADALILNKTDLVRAGYVNDLQEYLASLNPFAKVFRSLEPAAFPLDEVDQVRYTPHSTFFSLAREKESTDTFIPRSKESRQTHHQDIAVRAYMIDAEFNLGQLYIGLSILIGKYRDRIYRMKGVVFKKDEDKKVIIQSVGARLYMDYGGHWENDHTKQNQFVFIGKELDGLHIERYLHEWIAIPDLGAN
ncbi:GTP-binding protein [Parapedobacter sp. SGR-10]|uniref:CobW family GTP-binding protein n=1 Tax=Parapedobacter sp. SGR-10 TaxID=2710879 RepID=UPI0013D3424F|nr:GTP-binding protein [Parapedobacter sp. SGR-10]NGF57962.1 GTP-binding protein [Parapedobacter sp. SGR-10]